MKEINRRPRLFEHYTARDLWTDDHTLRQMLSYHLNRDIDVSSRRISFIDRSVSWMISRFRIGPQQKIVDFGCGPGLYTNRLARSGARVTGIDFSTRSLNYAAETAHNEGMEIQYINEDYLGFETSERFDLILMIMCDYCALSPRQRKSLLAKWSAMLNPQGYILFDVYTLNAFAH